MKYYSETRHYIARTLSSFPREDVESRIEKHEISEACFNLFTKEVFAGKPQLKNSDGSFSYSQRLNCHETEETTFWVEE